MNADDISENAGLLAGIRAWQRREIYFSNGQYRSWARPRTISCYNQELKKAFKGPGELHDYAKLIPDHAGLGGYKNAR